MNLLRRMSKHSVSFFCSSPWEQRLDIMAYPKGEWGSVPLLFENMILEICPKTFFKEGAPPNLREFEGGGQRNFLRLRPYAP